VTTPVYLSLLHYPITSREGKLIATAVTNLDIHDIARSCRTYGIKRYFIVTPVEAQHRVVSRILRHWKSENAKEYHPDRATALARVELCKDFDEVVKWVNEDQASGAAVDGASEEFREVPEVVLTDAQVRPETQARMTSYAEYRKELEGASEGRKKTRPVILVFGTGWGVANLFFPRVHRILAPVYGHKEDPEGEYNHLSVRAAVAIILDRLFGH
jgi:hypothetical protein